MDNVIDLLEQKRGKEGNRNYIASSKLIVIKKVYETVHSQEKYKVLITR